MTCAHRIRAHDLLVGRPSSCWTTPPCFEISQSRLQHLGHIVLGVPLLDLQNTTPHRNGDSCQKAPLRREYLSRLSQLRIQKGESVQTEDHTRRVVRQRNRGEVVSSSQSQIRSGTRGGRYCKWNCSRDYKKSGLRNLPSRQIDPVAPNSSSRNISKR